jgi:deoxycytidine triphosphate deaminase
VIDSLNQTNHGYAPGVLSYQDLCRLVAQGVAKGVRPEHINASSIDLTCGDTVLYEEVPATMSARRVNLASRDPLAFREKKVTAEHPVLLTPGDFALVTSREVFNLPPWLSATYCASSTMSRSGLSTLNPHWLSAGWRGSSLVIELKNLTQHHFLTIPPGTKLGQVVFFAHAHVPEHASYGARGAYNEQDKPVAAHAARITSKTSRWRRENKCLACGF